MLNVITATETVDRNGSEYTITTYAVAGYTLTRVESSDKGRVKWRVSASRDLPTITNAASYRADTPVFGVNWSACGTRSSVDARAYGALLITAADVADVFNRIVAGD